MFNIGDVVQLNSGGPNMTVYKLEYNEIYCIWFYDGSYNQKQFEKDALFLVESRDKNLNDADFS